MSHLKDGVLVEQKRQLRKKAHPWRAVEVRLTQLDLDLHEVGKPKA
jgi:hypothetical protein